MYYIEDADATQVMPNRTPVSTAVRHYFQDGNTRTGTPATVVTADFMNIVNNELCNVVEAAGITLDKMDDTQLTQAIIALIQNYIGGGGAGGIPMWSAEVCYDPLPHIVWGSDLMLYIAELPSGPCVPAGPKDPTTTTGYWISLPDWIKRYLSSSGSGSFGNDLVYPCAFAEFFEQSPPTGWMVRNGALIVNASNSVPELWAALQESKNAWRLLSESDWQAWSQEEPWKGVGGVPRFVLNVSGNTIRLPDTRGMYKEDAGFNGLVVGGRHGDGIRNLYGKIDASMTATGIEAFGNVRMDQGVTQSGVLKIIEGMQTDVAGSYADINNDMRGFIIDASLDVPTASVNQPKAFGVLGCVYVGPSAL